MSTVSVNPPKTPVTEGSNGVATATIPNICKMPGPPAPFVPTPLPNIGKSGKKPTSGYSTTVKIEGKNVAIQGASFGSMGDIASKALGGGIVSLNCEGPTKFLAPGSLNVKIEGKNVQQLGDQMLNNCGPSGSPPNAATMMGLFQDALIVKFEKFLCKTIKECEDEVNDKVLGKGNKPTRAWCKSPAPGGPPGTTNAMAMGTAKAKCAEEKINAVKARSTTPFSKAVQAEKYVPVPGGGWCKPDVMVGAPPSCQKVYDFKTSCPMSPSTPPPMDWPAYGPGGRTPPNPSYNGKTQAHIYEDACGVKPEIIHPNSEKCK
jgi:uncharacterized Zn-binding protein involved in type VI secretion